MKYYIFMLVLLLTALQSRASEVSSAFESSSELYDSIFSEQVVVPTWTLEELNNADWSEQLSEGQSPFYARLQVLLNRNFSSTGAIDGRSGLNTIKAISAYQIMQGLKGDGNLDILTWEN